MPDASTSDGKVSVAAAIALNIATASTTATVGNGVTLTAGGPVTIRSAANHDGVSSADGSATTTGDGTAVGAAVALSVTNTTNTASIGNAAVITADGLTVEAVMLAREIKVEPKEAPIVDVEKDTIFVDDVKGLSTGDEVVYFDGDVLNDHSIGGLNDLGTYYVIVVGEGKIKLAETKEDAEAGTNIDLTSQGTGSGHKLSRITFGDLNIDELDPIDLLKKIGDPIIEIDPTGNHYEIELGDATGLNTGDAVVYSKGEAGNSAIGGLTDGETYFAIIEDNGKLKLAATYADAVAGKKITLTGKGTGEGHKITEFTHSSAAFATSGASGGKIGVAGSVAINYSAGTTSATIAGGANVTLLDGGDPGTEVGDVVINADATSNNLVKAQPKRTTAGTSVGVGLSFGINIGVHDADAIVDDAATLSGANDVSVSADGVHTMATEAKAGAGAGEEGTAVGGSIALSVSDNDNVARVGAGPALDVDGDLVIHAGNANTQITKSDADTEGGQTGVGAAIALGWVDDDVTARLERDVSTGAATADDVTVEAKGAISTTVHAYASAMGEKNSDDGGETAEQQTGSQTDFASDRSGTSLNAPTPQTQVADANNQSQSQTSDPGGQGDANATQATTETAGGVLRIAASIGGSVTVSDVTAEIVDGLTIDSSGDLSVRAIADTDSQAEAISVAFTQSESESDNVSAAVAFNVALLDASAYLGNGTTVAGSVAVEAGTSAGEMNEFKAMALSGAGSKQSSKGGNSSGGTDAGGTGDTNGGAGTGGDSSSLGIAGAVAFTVYGSPATDDPNTVSATIADNAGVTAATGDVSVTARQDVGMQNIAGGAALTISSSGGGGGVVVAVAAEGAAAPTPRSVRRSASAWRTSIRSPGSAATPRSTRRATSASAPRARSARSRSLSRSSTWKPASKLPRWQSAPRWARAAMPARDRLRSTSSPPRRAPASAPARMSTRAATYQSRRRATSRW